MVIYNKTYDDLIGPFYEFLNVERTYSEYANAYIGCIIKTDYKEKYKSIFDNYKEAKENNYNYNIIDDIVKSDDFIDYSNDVIKGELTLCFSINPNFAKQYKENNIEVRKITLMNGIFVSLNDKIDEDDISLGSYKYLIDNSPEKLYEVGNRLPVIKTKLESDEIKNNEYSQGFINQAKSSIPMPNVSEISSIWEPLKNITRIFNGEDAETVAKDIKQGVKDGIDMSK